MGGKYSSKPVKKDDPSLNLEGGSGGKNYLKLEQSSNQKMVKYK